MKLLRSFGYAFKGLLTALSEQQNLKIHAAATVIVVLLGLYYAISAIEWCILLIMIALVIAAELINTAIENLTDLVTKEQNLLAGKVKDIAAAAVLVLSIVSGIVGILIFAKYV
jgi:diacylglycerol kinase